MPDDAPRVEQAGEVHPPMRCVVCLKPISEGTGHYRIVEGRFHVECMQSSYWPR